MTRGALLRLNERGARSHPVDIDIRYLNSRYRNSDEDRDLILRSLRRDFHLRRYGAVVTVDDDATRFMIRYRDLLDPEVPVIFGGVDRLDPAELALRKGWAGFGNRRDLRKRIDLAMRLQPGEVKSPSGSGTTFRVELPTDLKKEGNQES